MSPDILVSKLWNPQSFNRYSYCLNNPLKYIDPSGLTDVTVSSSIVPPYISQWYDENEVELGRDTICAVTDEQGTTSTVVAGIAKDGLLQEVVIVANLFRLSDGDEDLNIFWNSGDLSLEDHYLFGEITNVPYYWEQCYSDSSGTRVLVNSTHTNDWSSWNSIGQQVLGGALMLAGLGYFYFGASIYIAAYVPPYEVYTLYGIFFMTPGGYTFWQGYNIATQDNVYGINPAEWLPY